LEKDPVHWFGLGGPLLRELGVEMVYPPPLNVVGFTEVAWKIIHLFKAYQRVKKALKSERPDLIVLIDYPDMNLRLARAAHEEKIPVLYYISPQVWAWRPGRVKDIARYVDRLAVILPFEADFYESRGIRVDFVGHPLLDSLSPGSRAEIQASQQAEKLIGLLPGSRPAEIKSILPIFLETALLLTGNYGERVRFVLPVAGTLDFQEISDKIKPYQDLGVSIQATAGKAHKILADCHLAIVASGTVTLEAAILEVPMLIAYKVSPLNYWIARRLIDIPYVGLVNWVAGKKVIPEYIQSEAVPEMIVEGCRRYLEDPGYYRKIREELFKVRESLGAPGASFRVAQIVREMME
jgi:lipid-A-disaccharide synthase